MEISQPQESHVDESIKGNFTPEGLRLIQAVFDSSEYIITITETGSSRKPKKPEIGRFRHIIQKALDRTY